MHAATTFVSTTISGATVELVGDLDLSGYTASTAVFDVAPRPQEFTGGPPGLARETLATLVPGIDLSEQYAFQGGTLKFGTVEVPRMSKRGPTPKSRRTIGVWEHAAASIFTFSYGGSSAELMAAFSAFRIEPGRDGVVMRPTKQIGLSVTHPPSLLKEIPQGSLSTVALSQGLRAQLPRWVGTSVRGGELFVEGRDTPKLHYILATGTARVTARPKDWHEPQPLLDALETLEVRWR